MRTDLGHANDAILNGSGQLAATHDGGRTWAIYKLPGSGSIYFQSPLSGWELYERQQAPQVNGSHVLAEILLTPLHDD